MTEAKKDTGKKDVATKTETKEEVAAEATEEVTTEEEVTVIKGNGSYGKRKVKLADMEIVSFTQTAFSKLDPKGLVAALIDPDNPEINRISRERAKDELVKRIQTGRIILNPVALADVTYKNIVVKGVKLPKTVRGVSEPKEALTEDAFDKLTAEAIAAYVEKYTHKRRVANVIIPDYIIAGMPMSAEDVVSITNGRVAVKGVVVQRAGNAPATAITEGVEFG